MKKFLQKRLSVFLALLMVFSMFVFTPEMFTKAEAASDDTFGPHKVRLWLRVGSDEWECNSGIQLKVLYRTKRSDTTSQSAVICTTSSNNFNTTDKNYYLGNASNSAGMDDTSGRDGIVVNGFPVGWDFSTMKSNNSCQNAGYTGHLEVWNENTGSWVEVASAGETIGSGKTFSKKDAVISTGDTKAPSASRIDFENPGSGEVTVKPAANASVSGSKAATVYDQYGVVLTTKDLGFRLYDTEIGTSTVSTTTATVARTSDNKPTVTVLPAAADWVLAGGSTQRSMYAQAYCGNVDSGSDRYEVMVSNYAVTVTYNLNGGTYWGTEDDHSATATEEVGYGGYLSSIPQTAYRKGYTFNGIFTATSGGTKVTTTTPQIKAAKTFYAQWSPIDNPVEFYNSDGQLIVRYNSKYDTLISAVGAPATPTYPGKTQAVNGSYVFDKWIVWDSPVHPDWVGSAIGDHAGSKLDDPSSDKALKFIAAYKLSAGATAKTYTADFLNAGGLSIGSTTGAYWTLVTPYGIADKPALQQGYTGSVVTTANGFDLTNYDYTFEGWTSTVPANGKWGTEEDVEYTSETSFRIKENIKLYPCYSKSVKQCTFTKKYFAFNAAGVPVIKTETVAKSAETALGLTFDLGTSDPFSFNYGGYTYTFKGWKETTSTIAYGTGTADIPYSSGKATITVSGDKTYFAIYEKTEIKFNAYYYNGSTIVGSYENLSRYSTGTNLITYKTAEQFDGETPVKARNGQTGYTFVGWVEDQSKVLNPSAADLVNTYTFGEQSKSFYAAYKSFDYYTVTFRNDDGEVLRTSADYVADDVIRYTADEADSSEMFIPVVKNKASGVQFQYTFMGWKSNVEADNVLSFEDETVGVVSYAVAPGAGNDITVNADRVYTAVFKKEIREYQISLYDIGTDPALKVNADGYGCYTNGDAEYFVKGNSIFTKNGDEYVAYEGSLKIADLEAVKSEPISVLTLKYGDNILNAVKALYGYAGGSDEKNVTSVAGTELKVVPYGEDEMQVIPYETDQYSYSFNGWNPAINPNATVIGDASYVATYRTDNVLYNVHWYTPTSFGASEPYSPLTYSSQTTNYRYKRAIAVPAKTPSASAPASVANYTWSFLGWYECDENQVIKTDAEGNEIKYSKGTLADPGDNHNRDFYYVAKFGFVANTYTIRVYNDLGTVLLGTYKGAYGSPVYLSNFRKNSDESYHYELDKFIFDNGSTAVAADADSDTTEYIVMGNADLSVSYKAEAHNWADAAITHTTLPTYKDSGLDTYTCSCGFKKTEVINKLIDVNAPEGKVAIKSYNWDKDGGAEEAYVRADSLIAIMAVDCGENDAEGVAKQNEGNGIKSITYTWSNGVQGGSVEFEEFEKTSANVDVQIPTGDDFTDGMTLTAVITDWTNKSYTITTGALYVDSTKPVIDVEATCEGFKFGVKEDHINSVEVTLNGEATDISAYAVDGTGEGYAAAYIAEKTETELVAEGKYVVTVTDKAGNTATAAFEVTNAHEWNDGKVTLKATCTADGEKTYTCTACGDTKTEVIAALGHDWDAVYEGEGEEKTFVEYVFTTDVKATCTEDGSKSVHCKACDEKIEVTVIPATGHAYKENVKEATCKAAGYEVITCEKCDYYVYTPYEQLEHIVDMDAEGADENGWVVGKAATCTAKGETHQVCALCGDAINKTELEIAPHNFKDITPEGDYCTDAVIEGATPDTYHLYKCEDCGYTYVFNTEAKEHKIVKTVKSEPTCTEDRIYTLTCEKGDMEAKEERERLTSLGGHSWNTEYTIDKSETCTEDGAKSIYCSVCGELKEGSTVVIPAAHKYESVTIAATCHTEGKIVYTCTACDDTYEEITGPALPSLHVWDDGVETKAPTCTEEGEITYTCTECGEKETETVTKLAHEASDVIAEHADATCKDFEKTVYKCKNCDEGTVTVYGTEYADHVKGALVKTITKATCTTDGEGLYNCAVCGQTFTAVIPATGEHSYTSKITLKPTCTAAGVKTFTCTVCGDTYTEDVDALGHSYAEYKEDATCTAAGFTCMKCTVCGEVEEGSAVEIPSAGHTWVTDEAVESTCTKTGLTEGEHCSVCGEIKTAQTATEKKPHTKGNLITTKTAATCVKDGLGVYMCTVCNDSFEAVIPADGTSHSFGAWGEWTEVTAATCTEAGLEKSVRACLNAGCTETEEKTRETAALDHNFVVDHIGDPVTADGVTTVTTYYVCSRCGETKSEDTVTTLYTVTIGDKEINLINGEKLTEAKIEATLGTLPTKAADASEDGEYVVVWKLDGAEVKLPATVSANSVLTYEFKFVPYTYTVTFYNYSGKIISQTEYVKGAAVAVPDDLYVSGFRFEGWTDGVNNYAPDAVPAVTETVNYTPWVISNDNFVTYYVTFKNDTGSKTLYTASVEAQKGETVSFALPSDIATPTKAANSVYHYEFAGWVDAGDNAVAFPMSVSGNVTLKAKFTAAKHTEHIASTVVTPANCKTSEITKYTCTCGYTWEAFTAPASGHSYVEIGREVNGNTTTIKYYCTVCDDEYTRTVTTGTQTDVIVVRVTDGSAPVGGAKVTVYLNATQAVEKTTDADGNAIFAKETLPDGTYQVKVTKDNYDTATGQMTVKNGTASLKISLTKQPCHCICHDSGFFGSIRRFLNKFIRLFNKNYTCCSCGECEKIHK